LNADVVATGLTKSVFQEVILRLFQWNYDEYFLGRLFCYFDVNRDKRVDFKELISGLSILIKGTNEEKLKMCFTLFDRNSDDFVDREEMHAMLTALYNLFSHPNSPSPKATQSGGLAYSTQTMSGGAQANRLSGSSSQSNLTQSGGAQSKRLSGGASQSNMLAQSGGAQSNRLSGGSSYTLTQSGGAQSNRLSGSASQSSLSHSGGAMQSNTLSQSGVLKQSGVLRHSGGLMQQNNLSQSGAQLKRLSGGTTQGSEPAQPKRLSGSGGTTQGPDPAHTKASAIEIEQEKVAPDYASEVTFFVDMLFNLADATKDGLLSFDEFREAALLQHCIVKTFNLDHQHNYNVRISIG
jgi:Ca2+-binding EF-hand superfamily protein